jgi:hypothetical protein
MATARLCESNDGSLSRQLMMESHKKRMLFASMRFTIYLKMYRLEISTMP